MSTIINRIKEKTNIPIDWNNINRASIKAMRLDRKNLNIGNTPWTTCVFQLIKFAKNKVMSKCCQKRCQLEKVVAINFDVT